jgi:hypothetical protein
LDSGRNGSSGVDCYTLYYQPSTLVQEWSWIKGRAALLTTQPGPGGGSGEEEADYYIQFNVVIWANEYPGVREVDPEKSRLGWAVESAGEE